MPVADLQGRKAQADADLHAATQATADLADDLPGLHRDSRLNRRTHLVAGEPVPGRMVKLFQNRWIKLREQIVKRVDRLRVLDVQGVVVVFALPFG